jgi:hypothetical protein
MWCGGAFKHACGVLPYMLRLDDEGIMTQLRLVAEDIGLMRQARLMRNVSVEDDVPERQLLPN